MPIRCIECGQFCKARRRLCSKHYTRWYRHGSASVVKPPGPGIRGLPLERRQNILWAAGRKGGMQKARVFWYRRLIQELCV